VRGNKKIFAIIGSASKDSANEKLIEIFAAQTKDLFDVTIFNDLKSLPHFDPELSTDDPPLAIKQFRSNVENADGIIICTPEYVFSIPSGLKNAIEWCVATTIFSDKPTGLVTASAIGQKADEELQLIMKTVMAKFIPETTLLIPGVKAKVSRDGVIMDEKTNLSLTQFIGAFHSLTS
jgi:chromate reductase